MRALVVVMILAGGNLAMAECAPEKMIKIVFRDATPGIPPESFAAQPKILYRLGSHYQRMEEAPDRENGIHGLIVSNKRDHWMVNLADKTGQHIVDTAESYDSHAPILGGPGTPFAEFEFGCEVGYMRAQGIKPTPAVVGERNLLQYEHSAGELTVRLMVIAETGVPDAIGLFQDRELVYFLRYVVYEPGLETNASLFERPSGISYVEAK